MPEPDRYNEDPDARDPALRLLARLGWTVLSAIEANALRDGPADPLLRAVLEERLAAINTFEVRGQTHRFSLGSIDAAVRALREVEGLGLSAQAEAAYDLITLGTSLPETVDGDRKSHDLRYVDWDDPAPRPDGNAYHAVRGLVVQGTNREREIDVALFVNGVPFAAIECKRRDQRKALDAAISQLRGLQTETEGAPDFFRTVQVLLAAQPNGVRYGTVGTPREYWSRWRESGIDEALAPLLADENGGQGRLPTELDRHLWALFRPEALLELSYRFTLFDGGKKKIARYQQVHTVRNLVRRVQERDEHGRRRGGVVWHTQGSGKSLTMVFLAKGLALSDGVGAARVCVVTDRKSLDKQITRTLRNCAKEPRQAKNGKHLAELLAPNGPEVVTTTVHKFDTALRRHPDFRNASDDLFVLVDEAHRTQYGRLHARMRRALPNACFIAFTGTPIAKDERAHTARQFGGIIDPAYTIDQATADKAVVPIVYEGRLAAQAVQGRPLDRGFDRVAEDLPDALKARLKKKGVGKAALQRTERTLEEVVLDAVDHYVSTYQGTGLKAQFTAGSKADAVRVHDVIRRDGRVKSAVVVSAPDQRESEDDADTPTADVLRFWRETVDERFQGDAEAYKDHVLDRFDERPDPDDEDAVEMLVVCDMLLTGFDAPRNTALYLHRKLTGHKLLQAIARVNRLHESKDVGVVLDYWGVLEDLDAALDEYTGGALAGFDRDDVAASVVPMREHVASLGALYERLLSTFDDVDRDDNEALERHLEPEDVRHSFYDRLSAFSRSLGVALSSETFEDVVRPETAEAYRRDLAFFQKLRRAVRIRYAEDVDHAAYEARLRRLLDAHVSIDEVERITAPINLLDREAFEAELSRLGSDASRADAIARRTKRVIDDKLDENPALYTRLSELVQQAIDDYRQGRLDEVAYLRRAREAEAQVQAAGANAPGLPPVLRGRPEARPYFDTLTEALRGIVREPTAAYDASGDGAPPATGPSWRARIALDLEQIVEAQKVVDWERDPDVERAIRNEVEDHVVARLREAGLPIEWPRVDRVLDDAVRIAKSHASGRP